MFRAILITLLLALSVFAESNTYSITGYDYNIVIAETLQTSDACTLYVNIPNNIGLEHFGMFLYTEPIDTTNAPRFWAKYRPMPSKSIEIVHLDSTGKAIHDTVADLTALGGSQYIPISWRAMSGDSASDSLTIYGSVPGFWFSYVTFADLTTDDDMFSPSFSRTWEFIYGLAADGDTVIVAPGFSVQRK